MGDRRFEVRHDTAESVELRWVDAQGTARRCSGIMMNFSRSGARVDVESSIRVNTLVEITARDQKVVARVQWCIRRPPGHRVGLELADGSDGLFTTLRAK